jgi:nitroimidazol reductase NimA-like FMN-containing flavoprotein (pyridoxamine 5'-phosphate oxidase superfamily)
MRSGNPYDGSDSPESGCSSGRYIPTERTAVRRRPERASYDRALIHQIIDESLICHVAVVDHGEPRLLPTAIMRIDEDVYIHGGNKNGLLATLADGAPAVISVTLVDGIVAGRSGFGCSMDYRSVIIYGTASVLEPERKEAVLDAFVQDLIPGHKVRRLSPSEVAATTVLRFPLAEVSAKVRNHGVSDVAGDYDLDLWAGVIPVSVTAGHPVSDSRLKPGIPVPEWASNYRR